MTCEKQPVRPQMSPFVDGEAAVEEVQGDEHSQEEEEEVIDPKQMALDEPVTGVDVVLFDENGPGALEPRAISSPKDMTPAQRAKHNLTHLPMHPGCAICRMRKSPNMFHVASHEHERAIPLLVGDCGFLR